jgi:hypothetical protein
MVDDPDADPEPHILLGPQLRRYEAHRTDMPPFLRHHMASQLLCAVRSFAPRTDPERDMQRAWIEHLLATQRAAQVADTPPPWPGTTPETPLCRRPFRVVPGALYAYDLERHGYMRHPNRYDRWLHEYAITGTPPDYASDPDLDMSAYDDPLTDEDTATAAPSASPTRLAPTSVAPTPVPAGRARSPRKRRPVPLKPPSDLFATLGRCAIVRRTDDGRLVAEQVRGQRRELARVAAGEGHHALVCYALGRAVGPSPSAHPPVGFAVFFGGCDGDVDRFVCGLRRTVVSRAAACPHLFHVVCDHSAPLPEDLVVVSADWSSLAGFAPRGPADLFDGVVSPLGRPRRFVGIDSRDALLAAFARYFRQYVARYG